MKKLFKLLTTGTALGVLSVSSVFAADIEVVNKKVDTTVATDTILIGKTEAETNITELITELSVNNETITKEDYANVLDVRYLSGTIDKKVFTITDKIPSGAETFILFKPTTEGGKVSTNTPVKFTVNNINLETVAKIDATGQNRYIETGKFNYSSAVDAPVTAPVEPSPVVETQPINTEILKEEKTGIFDQGALIALAVLAGFALFMLPTKRNH